MDRQPVVVVVDDEVVFCDVIRLVLEDYGVQTLTANSVAQAKVLLQKSEADMFILDVMMPGVDGLAFVRQLRADPANADKPILIASAKAMAGDREAALAAGANHYLPKPFTAKQLRNVLRHYLPLPTTGELRWPWRTPGGTSPPSV